MDSSAFDAAMRSLAEPVSRRHLGSLRGRLGFGGSLTLLAQDRTIAKRRGTKRKKRRRGQSP